MSAINNQRLDQKTHAEDKRYLFSGRQRKKETKINKQIKWSKNSLKNGDNMQPTIVWPENWKTKHKNFPFCVYCSFPSLFCFSFTPPHFLFPHPLSLSLSLLSRNHVIKLVGICNHVYVTECLCYSWICLGSELFNCENSSPTSTSSSSSYKYALPTCRCTEKNMWNLFCSACNAMLQCNTHAKAIF